MDYYDAILAKELLDDEGFRTSAYQDTAGYWTVGVGHMLGRDALHANVEWSPEEVILTFLNDINSSIRHVQIQIHTFDSLSVNRQRVLVNMMFNLGPNRFSGFMKFINAVNSLDYYTAYKEMLDSKWAERDVPPRAKRLAQRWLNG